MSVDISMFIHVFLCLQLREISPDKPDKFSDLVLRYLVFDEEMGQIGAQWRDVESKVVEYRYVQILNLYKK